MPSIAQITQALNFSSTFDLRQTFGGFIVLSAEKVHFSADSAMTKTTREVLVLCRYRFA
jgi:hypothetical protein